MNSILAYENYRREVVNEQTLEQELKKAFAEAVNVTLEESAEVDVLNEGVLNKIGVKLKQTVAVFQKTQTSLDKYLEKYKANKGNKLTYKFAFTEDPMDKYFVDLSKAKGAVEKVIKSGKTDTADVESLIGKELFGRPLTTREYDAAVEGIHRTSKESKFENQVITPFQSKMIDVYIINWKKLKVKLDKYDSDWTSFYNWFCEKEKTIKDKSELKLVQNCFYVTAGFAFGACFNVASMREEALKLFIAVAATKSKAVQEAFITPELIEEACKKSCKESCKKGVCEVCGKPCKEGSCKCEACAKESCKKGVCEVCGKSCKEGCCKCEACAKEACKEEVAYNFAEMIVASEGVEVGIE